MFLRLACGLLIGAGVFSAGCGGGDSPPQPPLAAVTVAKPLVREVIEWDEYTGHLESPKVANVQARVSGFIESAPFQEGALVHQGDVLFLIDDRPFVADLNARKADVAKARSQAGLAEVHLNRYVKVRGSKAISEDDYDQAKAALSQAQAVLDGALAAQRTSELNYEWTRVVAPISGRISRKSVTEGNLVTGGVGQGTLLTTITSVDPIYCYVDVDEQSVLKYQRLAQEKKRISARDAQIPVFMQLENETAFPHEGVVDFVDNKIDQGTGTLRARGVFANPNGLLTPGFFTRVRVPGSGRYLATLVPDAAIGTDQNLKFVLTVGADGIVQLKPVVLGAQFGTLRSIESGINANDRVIINGLQRARPGTKVNAQETAIKGELYLLTAPGSPTTQALPATRALPATEPAETQPETRPVKEGESR